MLAVAAALLADVQADVGDGEGRAGEQLEIGVRLDGGDLVDREGIGHVGLAGLHGLELGVGIQDVAPDDALEFRRLAPVIGIRLDDALAVDVPLDDPVRAGADRLTVDRELGGLVRLDFGRDLVGIRLGCDRGRGVGAAELDDLLAVGDRERERGQDGRQGDVGDGERELERGVVDRVTSDQ